MATWVKLTDGGRQIFVNLDHALRIEKIEAPKEVGDLGTRIFFTHGGPMRHSDDQFMVVRESPDQIVEMARVANA